MIVVPTCDGTLELPAGGGAVTCDGEWDATYLAAVPHLTSSDIALLFGAVVALWATAWVFRWLLRELKRS